MLIRKNDLQPGILAAIVARIILRFNPEREQKCKSKDWGSYAEYVQYKLLKLRLRVFSNERIDQLHRLVTDVKSSHVFDRLNQGRTSAAPASPTGEVTFKHSGNAGDLIYALPAMRALSKGRPAKLFLNLGAPVNEWSAREHPLGRFGLNDDMAKNLKPLLEHQAWLSSVQIQQAETVDYDLDLIRHVPNIKTESGDIARWYFWVFGVWTDLSEPWLELRPSPAPGNRIVLARSSRYRNPNLNYEFLREVREIDFVGTRSEFDEMRRLLPHLNYVACSDFLQLARIIKSARFFIGNQSFPYSLAEALKVPRILEVYPLYPNVASSGGQAAQAFFQPHFENLFRHFLEQHPH